MMKKFYFSLGKWFISAGVVLLPAWALANANHIEMSSYFPTPYVTYNNVFVTEQFDVGTSKSTFTLSLGSRGVDGIRPSLEIAPISLGPWTLSDGTANAFAYLRTTPDGGPILSFGDVQIRSKNVRFGHRADTTDTAVLLFKNLRVNSLAKDKGKPVNEINAEKVTVDGSMYLMEDKFTNAALPGCAETVSWQKLALGNESDAWYLVCGDPVEAGEPPVDECSSWKWEWVGTIGRCSTPADKYLEAYITTQEKSHSSTELLLLVLPYSSCVTIQGTWSAPAGHPWYMPIDAEYHNSSTWCTAGGADMHNPDKGKMCLDVGVFRKNSDNKPWNSTHKMPACSNVSNPYYSTEDFGSSVPCETTSQPEIIWYSGGPSSADDGTDANPFRMYRAVCAD